MGYVAFLATQQVLALLLSLLHVPITVPFAAGCLVLASLVGVSTWRVVKRSFPEERNVVTSWMDKFFVSFSVLPVLVIPLLVCVAYLTPDTSCDGNAYHIPAMSMWAHRGYVHWVDIARRGMSGMVNGYPKGVELAGFVLVRATGMSALSNTINQIFLPLGILGVSSLAIWLGCTLPFATCLGFLWVLIPVNLFQATTVYVDSAYGSIVVAFLALWGVMQQLARSQHPLSFPLAGVFGAAAGLALAAKGSAVVLVGAVFFALCISVLFFALETGLKRRTVLRRAFVSLAIAASVALLVGGYWYVRNYLYAGSPLYPVGVTVAGKVLFPGNTVGEAIAEGYNTPEWMQAWPRWKQIMFTWSQSYFFRPAGVPAWPESIMGVGSILGGLGYLWIFGCIPAIAGWVFSAMAGWRTKFDGEAVLLLIGLVVMVFLGTPMNWWTRYTVWLYGLGLPIFGICAQDMIRSRHRPVVFVGVTWMILCLAVASIEGVLGLEGTLRYAYPGVWPPKRISDLAPAAWTWPANFLFPETRGTAMDRVIEGGGRVAVGVLEGKAQNGRLLHNIFGELALPLGKREILIMPKPVESAALFLRERKPDYAIFDGTRDLPDYLFPLAERVEHVPGFWVATMKK